MSEVVVVDKRGLCEMVNEFIVACKNHLKVDVTLQDLIGNAKSVDQAKRNALYKICELSAKNFMVWNEIPMKKVYSKYLRSNLDIDNIYSETLDVQFNSRKKDFKSMSKVELKEEIELVDNAIRNYFVLDCAGRANWGSSRVRISVLRCIRAELEEIYTDGAFKTKDTRYKLMYERMDAQYEYCMSTIPSHIHQTDCRINGRYNREIDRILITAKDSATGKTHEFKLDKNKLYTYDKMVEFVNSKYEGHTFEIESIDWCSMHYVKRQLEIPIAEQYRKEVRSFIL